MSSTRTHWYTAMACDESDTECFTNWLLIHILALIPSFLSILSSIFIIVTGIKYHSKFKSNFSFAAELPIYISIADLTFAVFHSGDHIHSLVHNYIMEGGPCILFGAMSTFGVNLQTAWAFGVSVYLNRTIFNDSSEEIKFGKKNIYLHMFCWGSPSMILIFGLIFKKYGQASGPWCEIIADPQTHFFMVSIWMIIVIIAMIINYGFIIYKLRSIIIQTSFDDDEDGNYNRLHLRMKRIMRSIGNL